MACYANVLQSKPFSWLRCCEPKPLCTAEGKPLPTELKREETKLRHDVELEDDNTAVPRTHIDDEYAHAGERDPKILITTSRDPSTRLVAFAKELKLVFPNAQRINRGGMVTLFLVVCTAMWSPSYAMQACRCASCNTFSLSIFS